MVLSLLLAGGGSEASLAQQGSPEGRYGEALRQWENTLPRLRGDERFDTLLSMAAAYQAIGQVEKAFSLLKEAQALAELNRSPFDGRHRGAKSCSPRGYLEPLVSALACQRRSNSAGGTFPRHETKLDTLPLIGRGKVRNIYAVGDAHLLIVTTDHISAFDVVLPDPIPGKGAVLTALSHFWFDRTRHIVINHLASLSLAEVLTDPRHTGMGLKVRHGLPVAPASDTPSTCTRDLARPYGPFVAARRAAPSGKELAIDARQDLRAEGPPLALQWDTVDGRLVIKSRGPTKVLNVKVKYVRPR